jgi:cellobiose transport system substrate-binding protein
MIFSQLAPAVPLHGPRLTGPAGHTGRAEPAEIQEKTVDLSRRRFLQAAVLTAATAGATAACGGGSGSSGGKDSKNLALWYWSGGLSDKVVADAKKHFSDITLKTSTVGGDFKTKLLTGLRAAQSAPDITGIKGEDIASFLPNANRFIDLNSVGADKLAPQYLSWKLKQATTQDGKLIGFPIDIGPCATYYREDLFAKAGLPTDPAKVSAELATWDDYFKAGVELHKAVPKTYLINNIGSVFTMIIGQGAQRFIDENNTFIGDQDHIRTAWTTAVKPYTLGIDAKINDNTWNAAVSSGALGTRSAPPGTRWTSATPPRAPRASGGWRACRADRPISAGRSCPSPRPAATRKRPSRSSAGSSTRRTRPAASPTRLSSRPLRPRTSCPR